MEHVPRIRLGRGDLDEDPIKAMQQIMQIKVAQSRGRSLFRYNPHKQQLRFHWLGKRAKIRFFFGGNRTGKTVSGGAETVYHLTGEYPDWWPGKQFKTAIRCWACSETSEVTRDVAQKILLGPPGELGTGLIPKNLLGRVTTKRGIADAIDTVKIQHKSGRWSILQFKSYDQGRRKFQGTSRHLVWCDEEPPKDVFDEIRMRTMDVEGHILLTMTPLQGMSDVCLMPLGDPPDIETDYILASWQDNPYLSRAQISKLEQALLPHEREARQHGRPTIGAGKIYPFPRSIVEIDDFEIPGHWPKIAGMDFGWVAPTALVWGALDPETDILYLYSEHYLAETPPVNHAQAILARGDWIPIYGDPAGQAGNQKDGESLFDEYAKVGVMIVPAEKSFQKTTDTGIVEVYQRMQSGRLRVFKSLRFWYKEFDLYHRDEQGKIIKKHDHEMDATRFLVRNIYNAIIRPYGGVTHARSGPQHSYDEEFGGF